MNRTSRAGKVSILALFAAIVIIQNYVPFLGYIPVGPLSITTIQITVVIAAIVLGPKNGAVIGGIWGIADWLKAITLTSSLLGNVVMVNPLISVLPRILIGVVAGNIYQVILKHQWKKEWAMVISSVIGSLVNTVLVLSLIYIFYHNGTQLYEAINIKALMPYILSVAGIHGIPEAISAGIIGPMIALPLQRFTKFNSDHIEG